MAANQHVKFSASNLLRIRYNDFGQLQIDYQAHSGAVNTSTSPKVQYGYADGSANTIRPTSLTYPDGRELTYGFGATDGKDDALSRVAALIDDDASSTHLADYLYLGLETFIEVNYPKPDVKYTLVGTAGGNDPDTGDIYRGLDRFGRIKDSYWYHSGTSTDVDRIKYGHDRNGSRLWRENTVAASLSKDFDELYGYDLIDRLKTMDRGDLGANKDSVSSLQFAQDWSLDATGNWRRFREDDDGAGWDLEQQRTANKVNEITDITETTGPSWVTPAYDRAGNMTTIPKLADPTVAFTGIYDAWNRLVKIKEGDDDTVAEYQYDGAMRRTVKKTYSGGALDETRHFYFTEPTKWQVIEERVDGSSDPERQFVWGQRYIDDVVLRDRDTTGDGTLDERLYGMQDANWNVTGIVATAGVVQERYAYSAYGEPVFMDANFGTRASSTYEWGRLFAGYVWDEEVEWYGVRNRVYVPIIGFAQRDHSDYSVIHPYKYANDNPIIYLDASGLVVITAGTAATIYVVGAIAVATGLVGVSGIYVQGVESGELPTPKEALAECVGTIKEIVRATAGELPEPTAQPTVDIFVPPPPRRPDDETCAERFPGYPICPTQMYVDRKEACKKCNDNRFKPANHFSVSSSHFADPAIHWSCLRTGAGDRLSRLGDSVLHFMKTAGSGCQRHKALGEIDYFPRQPPGCRNAF